jgi:hypothetical protein
MPSKVSEIIRACYRAYEVKDRRMVEERLAEEVQVYYGAKSHASAG